jgi:hypothetical protein
MAKYTMEDVFEDVVLEIGDGEYRLRQRTKTLGEKVIAKEQALANLPEDAPDEDHLVIALDLLDLVLEPLGNGSGDGPKTHVKTVLSKGYQADEVGADRIFGLLNFCRLKMMERLDPTSSQPSGS